MGMGIEGGWKFTFSVEPLYLWLWFLPTWTLSNTVAITTCGYWAPELHYTCRTYTGFQRLCMKWGVKISQEFFKIYFGYIDILLKLTSPISFYSFFLIWLLENLKSHMWPDTYFYCAVLFQLISMSSYTKAVFSFKGIFIPVLKINVSSWYRNTF